MAVLDLDSREQEIRILRQPVEVGQELHAHHALAAILWRVFLRSRNVWALCFMYSFLSFSGDFITNWLPSYLRNRRHLSDEAMARLSALPLAFGIVSCVLGGTLSDWLIRAPATTTSADAWSAASAWRWPPRCLSFRGF